MKNILFLSIDSLRSDYFYGSDRTCLTPNIDKLIKNNLYFKNSFSASDATLLSWSSMFTGLFPFKTGITKALKFVEINKNTVTIFDILASNNYQFYGFRPIISETVGLFPKFLNKNSLYDINESLENDLGKKIVDLLKSKKSESPWFCFIHIMDMHFPIRVPDKLNSSKFGKSKYERALSNIDIWVGKFLDSIDHDETLVIITADHGAYIKFLETNNKTFDFEEVASKEITKKNITKKIPKFLKPVKDNFFYRNEIKKNIERKKYLEKNNLSSSKIRELSAGKFEIDHTLFDPKLKTPLLFVNNSIKSSIEDKLVRSVDILPTICDFLGIECNLEKIDGVSLISNNFHSSKDLVAYIESTPLIDIKSNDVIGIRTSTSKYFRDKFSKDKRIHLYDIPTDPLEENNLVNSNPELVFELEKLLQSIINIPKLPDDGNILSSKEIEDELKKMGYV